MGLGLPLLVVPVSLLLIRPLQICLDMRVNICYGHGIVDRMARQHLSRRMEMLTYRGKRISTSFIVFTLALMAALFLFLTWVD